MAAYVYKVMNEAGNTLDGVMEAESPERAREKLAALGYIPVSVQEGAKPGQGGFLAKLEEFTSTVGTRDLIIFTKQFRTMIKAGLSILELLKVLEEQTQNKRLKKITGVMIDDIKQGKTLLDAFSSHPKIFSNLYCSMIGAGEKAGSLPEVLNRLIYIIEHEAKMKADIRSALQYPITVVIALGLAFFVLLTFVIPKFVLIFKAARIPLPLPTLIAMNLYDFLSNYGLFLLGAVMGLVFGLNWALKTAKGRLIWDQIWLRVPVFGPLLIKAAMSRFAAIFAIMQSSGVSVMVSFDILSGTIGNSAIAQEFLRIKDMLKEGRGISSPFRQAKYFPPMVVNMVAIGEETGNLDEMLNSVSSHYDDEVEYAVHTLTEVLNPVLIVGLAAVVGFFALAIFLPMWDLTKMVPK